MTKKFTIVLAFLCTCHLLNAQGVRQLWGLNREQLLSIDTLGNILTVRNEINFGAGEYPIDFKVANGKIYGTLGRSWFLYEFDPLYDGFTGRVPMDYHEIILLGPVSHLVRKDNILYGVSSMPIKSYQDENGDWQFENAPIFEWNADTKIFTERITAPPESPALNSPIGSMTEWNGKFYGMTWYGGANGGGNGNIYEWDPMSNALVSKVNFDKQIWDGYSSYKNLTLAGNKFYCIGLHDLYEWDPVTNHLDIKHSFTDADGRGAGGSLIESNGKLYGGTMPGEEQTQKASILFEWDPAGSGTYTPKIDLGDYNLTFGDFVSMVNAGDKIYGLCQEKVFPATYRLFTWDPVTNNFTINTSSLIDAYILQGFQLVPAPVSMFTPGGCVSFPSVTVDATNNNRWVPITDSKGDVLAEIHPHGNNLGLVTAEAYINNGAVRTDGAGKLYLDRNMTITPENQPNPGNPVEVRLYITKREFETLKAAPSSGITDISDLAIFKNEEACSGNITTATEVTTTYEDYEFGYVLKAFIPSFSSFYFSKRVSEVLPLELLDFSGTLQNNDAVLQWKTDNEHNTHSFDIERSSDGIHFSVVGNTTAKNTPGKHQYNFTDKDAIELSAAILYYRLNQKDIDGKAKYSKIISIAIPAARLVSISPNPAGSFINVKLRKQLNTANTLIQIIDAGGRKVLEQKINPSANTHKINIIGLSKGVYMISVINNGERITSKFVKE